MTHTITTSKGTFLFVIKNFKLWKHWRSIRKGNKTIDFKRGCGYYIFAGFFKNPVGTIDEMKMESGKTGLYELIYYETFRDPPDMIKESGWHFVGYKGERAIKDCSFREFVSIYCAPSPIG